MRSAMGPNLLNQSHVIVAKRLLSLCLWRDVNFALGM